MAVFNFSRMISYLYLKLIGDSDEVVSAAITVLSNKLPQAFDRSSESINMKFAINGDTWLASPDPRRT